MRKRVFLLWVEEDRVITLIVFLKSDFTVNFSSPLPIDVEIYFTKLCLV